MRITKVATKTGDDGTTHGPGNQRVSKSSEFTEAVGTIDELNAHIGFARSLGVRAYEFDVLLKDVQNCLFDIGGELHTEKAAVLDEADVDVLDEFLDNNPIQLKNFVLPIGVQVVSELHVARAVCRRAERTVNELGARSVILKYLNRLSDVLFVMAVKIAGSTIVYWQQR